MSRWHNPGRNAAIMNIRRQNLRNATYARTLDERDIGNRPGIEEAFGFGDPRGWDGTAERFRHLAHRFLTRGV